MSQFLSDNRADLSHIYEAVKHLSNTVEHAAEAIVTPWLPHIQRDEVESNARNLAAYLALRKHELRALQKALEWLGLSTLGRSEPHVLETLKAVELTLSVLTGAMTSNSDSWPPPDAFRAARHALGHECDAVFGPRPSHRRVRIMVTLPEWMIEDPDFAGNLVDAGMNVARINCAHGAADEWREMIRQVREAAQARDKSLRVVMDLAGPKIRTVNSLHPPGKKRIGVGDHILLCQSSEPSPESSAFTAALSYPDVLSQAATGTPVWFDDGKLQTIVHEKYPDSLLLKATKTSKKGVKWKSDMGVNFPGTILDIPPLTAKDLNDLDFIVEHADMVGYSFVSTAEHISLLQEELGKRQHDKQSLLPLMAKIETLDAVKNLPEIMIRAAGKQPFALMIARGDLAVEIGYERLAEIQEEILWLTEAFRIPVIWATQVLEHLIKEGFPSRAEITDAAMGERAECVMLNKGKWLVEGVTMLDDLLHRMERHQIKKVPKMSPLRSWD